MTEIKLTADEIARVKGLGFLLDKNTVDKFNARVITRNGKITADEMSAIAEAARRFGSGEVAMTVRMTVEIQGISYANIAPLREFLSLYGLETGGTGPKVRPVVSCKGTTCQYGLIDTFGLSEKIHERFYKGYHEVKLPHKFKIGVGGCPNNCVKPDLNDIGIVGQSVPSFDTEKCRNCKKCAVEAACPMHAVALEDGSVAKNNEICNNCGRCRTKCPFGVADTYTNGYKIFIGGRWGKRVDRGIPISKLFESESEVLNVIERAICLFRDEGIAGERFADTIARLGFDYVERKLIAE